MSTIIQINEEPQTHILGTCPYCNRVFDRHKMVFNGLIRLYNCVECQQMLIENENERRVERQRREAFRRLQIQTTQQFVEWPSIPISAIDNV
jgi:hypothetical protein